LAAYAMIVCIPHIIIIVKIVAVAVIIYNNNSSEYLYGTK